MCSGSPACHNKSITQNQKTWDVDREQTDLDIVIVVVEEFSPVRHHIRATASENHMNHVARERGQLKIKTTFSGTT